MIIFISVLILIVAVLSLSRICFKMAFSADDSIRNVHRRIPSREQYQKYRETTLRYIDELESLPCESVSVISCDGLKLTGRYYEGDDSLPLAVCIHGYKSTGIRDFCAGFRILRKHGFPVLLADQRGHGDSEGTTICFGIREYNDVCTWANMFSNREIVLFGVSMGASSVLMAADRLPSNVRCIIADSPYDSAAEIIAKVAKDRKLPAGILMPFIALAARLYGGFSIYEKTASEAVSSSDIPVLVIHGQRDAFVPSYMSKNIPGKHIIFSDADHCMSCMVHPEEYDKQIMDFIGTKS